MRKWVMGIRLLLGLVLVLLIFVLYRGISSKQDRQTFQKASSIAAQLNSYTDSKFKVPNSLAAVGAKDVPSTITYTKLSSTTYRFCVTYKYSNKDVTGKVASDVTSATSGLSSSANEPTFSGGDGSAPFDLTIESNYKAGQNCQKIDVGFDTTPATPYTSTTPLTGNSTTPSTGNTDSSGNSTGTSDPWAVCDSIQDNTAWQQCNDKVDKEQGVTDNSITQ